jgi:hypothetical protein
LRRMSDAVDGLCQGGCMNLISPHCCAMRDVCADGTKRAPNVRRIRYGPDLRSSNHQRSRHDGKGDVDTKVGGGIAVSQFGFGCCRSRLHISRAACPSKTRRVLLRESTNASMLDFSPDRRENTIRAVSIILGPPIMGQGT